MGTFILFYANGHTFRYYTFVFSARSVHSAHEYTKLFTKFEYKERFQKMKREFIFFYFFDKDTFIYLFNI